MWVKIAVSIEAVHGEVLLVIVVATGEHKMAAPIVGQASGDDGLLNVEPGVENDLGETGLCGCGRDRGCERNRQANEYAVHGCQYTFVFDLPTILSAGADHDLQSLRTNRST